MRADSGISAAVVEDAACLWREEDEKEHEKELEVEVGVVRERQEDKMLALGAEALDLVPVRRISTPLGICN